MHGSVTWFYDSMFSCNAKDYAVTVSMVEEDCL